MKKIFVNSKTAKLLEKIPENAINGSVSNDPIRQMAKRLDAFTDVFLQQCFGDDVDAKLSFINSLRKDCDDSETFEELASKNGLSIKGKFYAR